MSFSAKTVTFPFMISIENALKITNKPEPSIFRYDLAAAFLTTAVLSRNLHSFIHVVFDVVHAFHEADPVVAKVFEQETKKQHTKLMLNKKFNGTSLRVPIINEPDT